MKLTHLSRNISESSEEPSLPITDNTLNSSPSFLLEFFHSEFAIRSRLIGYQPTVDYSLSDSILKSHDSNVSEVDGIYKKDYWYENLLWKYIGIKSLLNGSFTDSILSSEFSVRLFSNRIISPENLITRMRNSTSLVLEDISTILAFISLFSSHKSISFDSATRAFLASFLVTFIHFGKSKGVFGFTIPNTPYFSHTLFSIVPTFL